MDKKELIKKIYTFPTTTKSDWNQQFLNRENAVITWDIEKLEKLSKPMVQKVLNSLIMEFKNFGILTLGEDKHIIKDKIWLDSPDGVSIELYVLDNEEILISVVDDPGTEDEKSYQIELGKKEFAILHGMMFALVKRHDIASLAATLQMQNLPIHSAY